MSELTDWFHPPVSPVHIGVYEILRLPDMVYYSKWDGSQWHWGWHSPSMASKENYPNSRDSLPVWRGLKEKPE